MPEDITIRPATVADAPIALHHRRAMFTDMGMGDPAGLDAMEATFVPYVTRGLGDGSYRGWLAQTGDGRVVAGGGLLVYEWPGSPRDPRPRRAYIFNLYTEPDYRRRGLAGRIIQAMIDWCRAEGFKSVALHYSADGLHLYESMAVVLKRATCCVDEYGPRNTRHMG
jgi:GNAT superfamily N-acetyltransferase